MLLWSGMAGAQRTDQSNLLTLPEEKPIRGLSFPSLSPDGNRLCFTYLGDLWTVPSSGGTATRLTVHESLDGFSRWSPDGKWIAFTSLRSGNFDVFLIPALGGTARQVTFHSASDILNDWSPDGTKLLFYSSRDTRNFTLYSIDLRTRAIKRLTQDVEALRFGNFSPDGTKIAYTRGGQPWWRPWYRGSMAAQTVLADLATGKVKTLLKTPAQQFWPMFAPDGKSVMVTTIYGDSNTPNLWRVSLEGGKPQPITKQTTDAVRWPSLARNGSRLAYQHNGEIHTAQLDGSDDKIVRILAPSDDKINNQERITLTQEVNEIEVAPDGKQIGIVLRGEIWVVPATGGDARRLTDDPAKDNDIWWSPDSKKMVFVSDRGNQPDLYLLDVQTRAITRLTNDVDEESSPQFSPDGRFLSFAKAGSQPGLYLLPVSGGAARKLAEGNGNNSFANGIVSHAWSPDSRWLAFSRMDRFDNRDIWVVPAVGGVPINITRYPGDNVEPKFTRDGRKLLFLSDRAQPRAVYQVSLQIEDDIEEEKDESGKPKPKPDRSKNVRIDFEDIHLRATPAMPPVGNVLDYAPTPDSNAIVFWANGNFHSSPMSPTLFRPITVGQEIGANIRFLPDGSRFFYLSANGTIRSLTPAGGTPTPLAFTASLLFDRRGQYRQAFNEFYRRFGSNFYDAKLHGVNWKQLRSKYEPMLSGIGTPEEFANMLSMMVGEVNSSHSEVTANSRVSGPQTATLGLFYDDTYAGPGLKVTGVLPKGPVDRPSTRIAPGEYILSVDGTEVQLSEDYYQTLQDKAGKTVELLVNSKPSKEGARTIKVKPISANAWFGLEYEARMRQMREQVDHLSNSRIAYAHISGMEPNALRRFARDIEGDLLTKEALILDIRGNNGGTQAVVNALVEKFSQKVFGYAQPRDGQRQSQPERTWNRPVALLIDQNSVSAAELFPQAFKELGLGKIIGVPTPGYVIGTYSGTLVDGTNFRLPMWAFYNLKGQNLENLGVTPDILVENSPEDAVAGRDRQLETAVVTLLDQLQTRTADAPGENILNLLPTTMNPNGGSSFVAPPRPPNAKKSRP
jgi:Tol biopolymer transport system component/C-terminal processing protease CtpA/Prc